MVDSELNQQFTNRAFLYGDGFFESVFINKNDVPLWNLHAERIENAAQALVFENIDTELIRKSVLELATKTKSPFKRARISIFRESGGLYTPTSRNVEFVVEIKPLPKSIISWPSDGIILGVSTYTKPIQPFSLFKSINSQLYVLAAIEKQNLGFDEMILLNQNEIVCECISSNIFWVEDEKLFTPSLSTGCVSGVMRSHLLKTCLAKGIATEEVESAIPSMPSEIFFNQCSSRHNTGQNFQWPSLGSIVY